jgi:hypothetical protein
VNIGVALTLQQSLAKNDVARIVAAHIELGIKYKGVDKAKCEYKEAGYFKALHRAKLAKDFGLIPLQTYPKFKSPGKPLPI